MFKGRVFEFKGHEIRKGADLRGADLSGLVGSEVKEALGNLKGLNFEGADLTGANFDGSELEEVNFTGADLTGASLIDCWFPQQWFGFANANLTNAKIKAATWEGEVPDWWSLDATTIFTNATLNGARLSGDFYLFKLEGASLKGAQFETGTVFDRCDFRDADFSGSQFDGTHTFFVGELQSLPCFFLETQLAGAKFIDVTGCAYFPSHNFINGGYPDFAVSNGIFYIDQGILHNHYSLNMHDYQWFTVPPDPQNPNQIPQTYVALTPEGFVRKPSTPSSVETELAEAKHLLDNGLIDQTEYAALRRKILGI